MENKHRALISPFRIFVFASQWECTFHSESPFIRSFSIINTDTSQLSAVFSHNFDSFPRMHYSFDCVLLMPVERCHPCSGQVHGFVLNCVSITQGIIKLHECHCRCTAIHPDDNNEKTANTNSLKLKSDKNLLDAYQICQRIHRVDNFLRADVIGT